MTNLKTRIRENIVVDKIIFKKDGSVEFRDTYFYRNGRDQDKFASSLQRRLEDIGITGTVLEAEDRWAAWPRESYFRVVMNIKEMEG